MRRSLGFDVLGCPSLNAVSHENFCFAARIKLLCHQRIKEFAEMPFLVAARDDTETLKQWVSRRARNTVRPVECQ